MGAIDDIIAESLTKAWGIVPLEKRRQIREGTVAGEEALAEFNDVTADDQVTPVELEATIKKILGAMSGTAGKALQAYLWSLIKHT